MSVLERQLDDKVCEVTEQLGHVTELEEEVAVKTMQLAKLRSDLEEKTKELVSGQSSVDKVKSIHREQCAELERQIELVSLVSSVCTVKTSVALKLNVTLLTLCACSWKRDGRRRRLTLRLCKTPSPNCSMSSMLKTTTWKQPRRSVVSAALFCPLYRVCQKLCACVNFATRLQVENRTQLFVPNLSTESWSAILFGGCEIVCFNGRAQQKTRANVGVRLVLRCDVTKTQVNTEHVVALRSWRCGRSRTRRR